MSSQIDIKPIILSRYKNIHISELEDKRIYERRWVITYGGNRFYIADENVGYYLVISNNFQHIYYDIYLSLDELLIALDVYLPFDFRLF